MDFVTVDRVISFEACSVFGDDVCIDVEIFGDGIIEKNEYFTVDFSIVDPNVRLRGPNQATVHIYDNDGKFSCAYVS